MFGGVLMVLGVSWSVGNDMGVELRCVHLVFPSITDFVWGVAKVKMTLK
jgi:hypothetical protein